MIKVDIDAIKQKIKFQDVGLTSRSCIGGCGCTCVCSCLPGSKCNCGCPLCGGHYTDYIYLENIYS